MRTSRRCCMFRMRLPRTVAALCLLLCLANYWRAAAIADDLTTKPARPAPEWLTRGVIYQIWLRSFTPAGTIAAATERLPSVAELGADVLYLSPICLQDADMRREFWSNRQKASETNNPRNPYRIADYNRIDPEFGCDADLRAFVTKAHQLKQHVLLDVVFFHCGPTAVLLEHPEWLKHDANGQISTGEWHFPVLNFENRELRAYLIENLVHWVKDFDVDGFRCDVADAIPLDFWEEARERLDAVRPDIAILAEGQRAADQVRAFDIDYGFSWYDTAAGVFARSQPATTLRTVHEKQRAARPQGGRFTRYTENHDTVNDQHRAYSLCGQRGTAVWTVVNFMIDGVPFLYNGQEIGDTTAQSIYARWPIRWEAASLPTAKATFAFHQKLCQLRHNTPALYRGGVEWLDNNQPDAIASFLRRDGEAHVVCVANFSNRRVESRVSLPTGVALAAQPLLNSGAKTGAADGALTVTLEGFGYFVAAQP